jgi:hypothetical protein
MVIKYLRMSNFKYYNVNEPLINFEIKEKLDGANFRFRITIDEEEDCWGITFGSRNVYPIGEDAEGGDFSKGEGKTFKKYMAYVREKVFPAIVDPEPFKHLVFFCEAMIPHKIKYEVPPTHFVIGFDVYDLRLNKWRKDWQELFQQVNIPTVKVFDRDGRNPAQVVNQIETDDVEERLFSGLDGKSIMEGIVMVDYDLQQFYKYKTKRYLAISGTKTKMPKVADLDSYYENYFTNDRIEEWILKMKVEGRYNKKNPLVTLMAYLFKDVFEEAKAKDTIKLIRELYNERLLAKLLDDKEIFGKIMELKTI